MFTKKKKNDNMNFCSYLINTTQVITEQNKNIEF